MAATLYFSPIFLPVFLLVLPFVSTVTDVRSCTTSYDIAGKNRLFNSCTALGTQDATLAWSVRPPPNGSLEVVFSGVAPSAGGWVGWGINPHSLDMPGTQAFIAFQAANGSTLLTYNVTSDTENGKPLVCTPISLQVIDMGVNIVNGTHIDIFVSMEWPISLTDSNSFVLNHIWNRGPSVRNFQPAPHALSGADLSATKAINMSSGLSQEGNATSSGNTTSSSNTTNSVTDLGTCKTSHDIAGKQRLFDRCTALGSQDAILAWSVRPPPNGSLEVVFSGIAPSPGGWVGWGINPHSLDMPGTQAFIAFQAANGSTLLTYNVTSDTEEGQPLVCTPISLHVLDMGVNIVNGTHIDIFVSMEWPVLLTNPNSSVLNHIWNRGPSVQNFRPGPHGLSGADLSATKAIDMSSGLSEEGSTTNFHENAHAILNTVGWGILLPSGVIAARYIKPFADPAWFYTHITIQMLGYGLGVAGWVTGLTLGNAVVKGGDPTKHGNIGIALFAICTLQMMAILLRPNKDHKIRKAWNIYHYALAASILILGIINIFEGFEIMSPPEKWRRTYITILVALGGIAIILEITTWMYVCRKGQYSRAKLQGATFGGTYQFEKGPVG